jgi:hypothetical protein
VAVNCALVSTIAGDTYRSKDEVLAHWYSGGEWRLYRHGPISVADSTKLRMAGFTHVKFIWQTPEDFVMMTHDLELK